MVANIMIAMIAMLADIIEVPESLGLDGGVTVELGVTGVLVVNSGVEVEGFSVAGSSVTGGDHGTHGTGSAVSSSYSSSPDPLPS